MIFHIIPLFYVSIIYRLHCLLLSKLFGQASLLSHIYAPFCSNLVTPPLPNGFRPQPEKPNFFHQSINLQKKTFSSKSSFFQLHTFHIEHFKISSQNIICRVNSLYSIFQPEGKFAFILQFSNAWKKMKGYNWYVQHSPFEWILCIVLTYYELCCQFM